MPPEIPANHYSNEDEISLIDLIQVILKRKVLLLGVFVVGTLLAITAAIYHQQQYLYAVSIEIGTLTDLNGMSAPVEPANTVKSKLDEVIIPTVFSEYINTNPGKKGPSFNVRSPKNSQLLILEGKGSLSDSSTIISLENAILSKLKADQAPLYELEKTNVANTLAGKDRQLEEQTALQQSLRAAQLRIAKQVELRTGQLKETRQRLERLIANRNKLGQGDSSVLGRLLADAEIEKAQSTVLELEQEVNLDLPAMRDELDRKLAASVRAHATIEADIARTRLQLENIQETRFISEPGLNPTPTGASKRVIIAVGILLSALLAIMSVFVAEFIARARVELVGRTSG
jgi:uncharacterized protein involved in exopolysaccharide biosynthesis